KWNDDGLGQFVRALAQLRRSDAHSDAWGKGDTVRDRLAVYAPRWRVPGLRHDARDSLYYRKQAAVEIGAALRRGSPSLRHSSKSNPRLPGLCQAIEVRRCPHRS